MSTSTTPLTELEAVNLILSVIGEAPLSSLSEVSGSADAVLAYQVLNEVNRAVQSHGWQFNLEKNIKLLPELTTGEIILPGNCLRVDSTGIDSSVDVVQRGTGLYNRSTASYKFTKPLMVDMVVLLDFAQIPQTARHYIAVRAARVFQNRAVGSETLFNFSARDEQDARNDLKRAEGITGDYNYLTGSAVARVLDR